MPANAPMVWARRAGAMTSDTAAMLLVGSTPPPIPVSARSSRKTAKLGAKADAIMAAAIIVNPPNATGRRPKESDSGPTITDEMPQPTNVAAESCPAMPIESPKSSAISDSSGGIISIAFLRREQGERQDYQEKRLVYRPNPGVTPGIASRIRR